jgi:hypothetical protein
MMIEDLVYQCENLTLAKSWYNNTTHQLYAKENGIYTQNKIKKGSFVGYIVGKQTYTWDVPPNKLCIWLNDYYVLDCRMTPRCITSMIRKTMGDEMSNCTMAFAFTNEIIDVYIIATCDIEENTELVVLQESLDDFL